MIIESVLVKNYRSIHDQTLYCDSLTALVGRNGSGKSSFLSALDLFYDSAVQVTTADFYNEDTSKPIEIIITFSELTREETRLFSKYITDRRLTVAKVIEDSGSPRPNVRFHGFHLQHPRFNNIRNAGPNRLIDAPMVVKSMMGRFGGCAASSGIGWRGGGCGLGRVRVLRCDWGGFRRLGRSG